MCYHGVASLTWQQKKLHYEGFTHLSKVSFRLESSSGCPAELGMSSEAGAWLRRGPLHLLLWPINTEILRYQNTLSLDSLKSLSLWYRGFIFRAQQFLVTFCGQCRVGNGVSECDIAHRAVWWQCTMGIKRKSSNSSCKCHLQTWEWRVQCCRLCRTTFHPRRASSPLIGWPGGLPRLWLVDQSCDVMLSRSTAALGSVIHMPTIQGHHYQHYHQTPDNYKHLGDWWSDVLSNQVERILNQDVFSKQLIPLHPTHSKWG